MYLYVHWRLTNAPLSPNVAPSLPTIVDSSSEDPPRRQAWEVVDKWTSILGPDYVVKVRRTNIECTV